MNLFIAFSPWTLGGIIIGGIFLLIIVALAFQYVGLYLQAWVSGAKVGFIDLVMMRFRKVNAKSVVINRISGKKAGIEISTDQLEAHYLAGGRITNVVRAMIAADKARIDLLWETATAIDLAGRDILEAVRTSVDPKVIDCPSDGGGKRTIDAVAGDGIQLRARARVTVRTNIARLVGGATEETIIARVGEGIISTIGSAETHLKVLENPDNISKTVLAKGLDAGTAFEILSIDIADVDVGENIGATLQAHQAEADKSRFQAEAEKRRAMAVDHSAHPAAGRLGAPNAVGYEEQTWVAPGGASSAGGQRVHPAAKRVRSRTPRGAAAATPGGDYGNDLSTKDEQGRYLTNRRGKELCRKFQSGHCTGGNVCPTDSSRVHQCHWCLKQHAGDMPGVCPANQSQGQQSGGKSAGKGGKGGKSGKGKGKSPF